MATPSFSLVAEEDLTCPVCFELLKDPNTPKLLDCPHVCCAVCIQKLIEGEREIVDCPECRHVTHIPKDGVDAMKTNLRLRNLAEKHDEHITKKSRSCPKHNILIDYYCKKCNIVGCSTCMMKNHRGSNHNSVDIEAEREEQNTQMDVIMKRAINNIEECRKTLTQLKTLKTRVEENLCVQRQTIEKQGKDAVTKVQEECQTLIDDLQKNEQGRIDRIDEETARLLTQIHESENRLATIRSTIEASEPHDVVTQHAELEHDVIVLGDMKIKTDINTNLAVKMSKFVLKPFTPTGTLGSISQVRRVQCELAKEFGDFQGAWFVTVTPSGLLVVTDSRAKQVHIYARKSMIYGHQNSCQYKKQSSLFLSSKNTTENPWGVAVVEDGKYLVARKSHIEVYSPSGKYKGVLEIKCRDESAVAKVIDNVRLMPDGRVLVGDYENSLLFILKENITLRTIKTSIKAARMTVMSNERVAMSSLMEGKVCVMDIESGRELKTFAIPYVRSLCYHTATDSLLVGRCLEWEDLNRVIPKPGSSVLEQYCATTGGLLGRLASGLYFPQDMTFTSSGNLVLADYKTVKVFKVKEI